jgi:hypothetical protein
MWGVGALSSGYDSEREHRNLTYGMSLDVQNIQRQLDRIENRLTARP